jgi:hypothetical protein
MVRNMQIFVYLEARVAAEGYATVARVAAEWAEREAEQRTMVQWFSYVTSLGTAVGHQAPPPPLFAPPPPPNMSTPVSMNVLVCMFILRVKPQSYLKPKGV